MPGFTERDHLLEQYKDSANLNARAELHRRFSTAQTDWGRWVFAQFELPPAARVLELGGGPGWLWRGNLDQVPGGWGVTCSDFSPGMVAEQEAALGGSGRNFTFKVIDAQDIPFAAAAFDGVIANHMLYHVPDRAAALAEIARVLKPGGAFYCATNGANHMRELKQLPVEFARERIPWELPSYVAFTLQDGAAELEAHFAQVAMRPYEDSLRITEVEPIVAYIYSTNAMDQDAFAPYLDEFRAFVAEKVAANGGVFTVTKETGLFVARKAG